MGNKVKNGDTVAVHYHGKLNDGSTFDSSEGRSPLSFKVGTGQVIKGFDDAVMDMEPGQKKTVTIPAGDAYGEYQDHMVLEFPKSDFPPDMNPEVGMELHMNDDQGHVFPVTIKEVKGDTVLLDANHALAGKDLTFEIELVNID